MTRMELEGFRERVEQTRKEAHCPAIALAIVKESEIAFAEGFGLRDVENDLPATADTLFAIGSCSKAFTSVSIALLVGDGKLEWDAPVIQYLPGFRMFDPVVTERLTPRDMLTHRSGLPRHEPVWYGSRLSREELVGRIRYLEPNKDLRQESQYNNLLYMTAGYLAGKAAGTTWEELVKERIFTPLEMKRSNFSVEVFQNDPNHALPYKKVEKQVKRIPFRNIDAVGPAGSINSSVLEMANWVKMHLNKGKIGDTQVLTEVVFNEMHAPQIVSPGTITDIVKEQTFHWLYAMGWWTVSYRGQEIWLHEGGIDGFTAGVYILPQKGIGVVGLSNLHSNYHVLAMVLEAIDRMAGLEFIDWNVRFAEYMAKMKQIAEEGKQKSAEERIKDAPATHTFQAYAGTYEHPGYGSFIVRQEGDGLVAHFFNEDMPLRHYHYDVFEFRFESFEADFKVQFFMDKKGNFTSLSIPLETSVKDILFTRAADESMKEKSFLERFVGEYEVMGMTMSVSVKGDGLLAVIPGQLEMELLPYQGTTFNVKGQPAVTLEFKLDETGRVVEAVASLGGMVLTAKKR